jgi:biotin carboxylase
MSRTRDVSKPSALILGNYRPALTTARELSGLGYRVILGVHPASTGAEWSRFVDEVLPIPPLVAGSGDLNAKLAEIAATRELALIVPISEAALNAVAAAAPHIPRRVHLVMPADGTVAICHDKYRWLLFARESGIPCPDFAVCSTLAELRAVSEKIGYPVVLRPIVAGTRVGKRKAVTLSGAGDEALLAPHWPDGTSELLVQRRFSGDRYNIYFAARDGALVREQHTISLRTDRADGSGQTIYGVTIERIPELSDLLAVAARRMRYSGVGCAQFLYDPATRDACFLEINPRFGASYAFIERIGMNLTRLAVEIATGEPVSGDYPAEGRAGTRFVWTYGDLIGIWYSLRHREIDRRGACRWAVSALIAAVRADVHVTWSWRDPCPALAFYGSQLRKTLARLLGATRIPGIRVSASLPRRA